jgi:hypothetical protein
MSAWRDTIPEWMKQRGICGPRVVGLAVDKYNDCYRIALGLWFGQLVVLWPRRGAGHGIGPNWLKLP